MNTFSELPRPINRDVRQWMYQGIVEISQREIATNPTEEQIKDLLISRLRCSFDSLVKHIQKEVIK